MADKKCANCGISYIDAHLTDDGYLLPVLTRRCGYYPSKCDDEDCMFCLLRGGHELTLLSNRHKWI